MERPRRLSYDKPPRPIQSGIQIVSIEDGNRYEWIKENVKKTASENRAKFRQIKESAQQQPLQGSAIQAIAERRRVGEIVREKFARKRDRFGILKGEV